MIFEIYTPEKLFLKGEATSVTFPCTDGELCILDNHMPLAASLKNGRMKIKKNDDIRSFEIGNGFTEIKSNKLTVFVSEIKTTDKQMNL